MSGTGLQPMSEDLPNGWTRAQDSQGLVCESPNENPEKAFRVRWWGAHHNGLYVEGYDFAVVVPLAVVRELLESQGLAGAEHDRTKAQLKHLLYFLLRDELTLGELEELVAQTVQALQLGGVVMHGAAENLVRELERRLRGPIDGQFEEVANAAP